MKQGKNVFYIMYDHFHDVIPDGASAQPTPVLALKAYAEFCREPGERLRSRMARIFNSYIPVRVESFTIRKVFPGQDFTQFIIDHGLE